MDRDMAKAREFFNRRPMPEKCVIAVGGLSGTGKSALTRRIRDEIGRKGHEAVWIRSDVVRKEIWGYPDPTWKLPPDGYSDDMTRRTFAEVYRRAGEALAAGKHVITDTAFIRPEQRQEIQDIACKSQAAFIGMWLEAPADITKNRVEERLEDPSDADASVIDLQQSFNTGLIAWHKIDASGSVDATWRAARQFLDDAGFDFGKKVEWDDIILKSREGCHKTGGESFEYKYFYKPYFNSIIRGLLDGSLKGYSPDGKEPPAFADSRYHVFLPLKGPEDVIFDADELCAFTENFTINHAQEFEQRSFNAAKEAVIEAIRTVAPAQAGNKVLKEIEFSCNSDDFKQEIGGLRTGHNPRP